MLWVLKKDRLNETVLFSTQNICLKLWVRKYLQFYDENFCLSKHYLFFLVHIFFAVIFFTHFCLKYVRWKKRHLESCECKHLNLFEHSFKCLSLAQTNKSSTSAVLLVCFDDLCPKSTAKVMAGRSDHITTLFPGQA